MRGDVVMASNLLFYQLLLTALVLICLMIHGSCPSSLRLNTRGLPGDHHKGKKAWARGLSGPPSGPLTPGDDLDAGRADTRHPLRPPPLTASHHRLAHTPAGCGHGGTRNRSTSRRLHTRSVRPAAIAGVHGRHSFAEPLPLVGSGAARGKRTLACGRQKL
jgi:hypothetical protein